MTGQLSQALELGGRSYPINADFRNVLTIFDAFGDNNLTKVEKALVCIRLLYREMIPAPLVGEAISRAYWFCDGGDIPKSEPEKVKTLDWNHDGHILFPALSKAAGTADIRSLSFLHWWTFLGLFGEITDGLFSTVMHIRRKKSRGQKLEKWEREFCNRNKVLITIRTPEEQAEIDETEEFLRTIL
ncbi:MAG: hypothetical protein IJX77_09625 [Ruminococcus sp.]|nr:hypothetical protein [Ruminococcus sp.]